MTIFGYIFEKFLPVGVEIAFLGQPRHTGILSNFDVNEDNRVALEVRYVGYKKNKTTGYWFDVNDFQPALDSIDIRSYGGLLVCYKNIEGRADFMPHALKLKTEQLSKLHKMLDIYKKSNVELLNVIEGRKVSEERKRETIENAKQLKTLKSITSDREVLFKKETRGGMGSSLFQR